VPDFDNTVKPILRKESLLFLYSFLVGILLLPIVIYFIGYGLFGEYSGSGFSAFYGNLHGSLRSGELAVWFLVLSPYLILQLIRSTVYTLRQVGRSGK
jgi:hypothetical protein